MSGPDKTKQILEELLASLYKQQGASGPGAQDSSLQAQDGQFLGKITSNKYDNLSILNKYGPYGSKYSPSSIFNQYSPYGSIYGSYSINNPYCVRPPKLFINGKFRGHVSANPHVSNRLAPDSFIYSLHNSMDSLLSGHIVASESHARSLRHENYIESEDGTFLGRLTTSTFDHDGILNQFGPYGSQFSTLSIFNPFGPYGGQFSTQSPFNQFTNTPPKVYLSGKCVARLTANALIHPRIDPEQIREWIHDKSLTS